MCIHLIISVAILYPPKVPFGKEMKPAKAIIGSKKLVLPYGWMYEALIIIANDDRVKKSIEALC